MENVIKSLEEQGICLYPNQKDGKVYLNIQSISDNLIFEILDISGHCIMSQKIKKKNMIIDLNTFENGIYKIRILDNNEVRMVKRIVKLNGYRN